MSSDVVFKIDDKKFNFRSVGVIINNNRILLHCIDNNPYWSLPGGRVEIGEATSETVIREMKEEIGVDCKIIRPLWVMENFFHSFGYDTHEIAFYFLLTVPSALLDKGESFQEQEGKSTLAFKWHPLDDIHNITLFPQFLRTSLKNLPESLTHITHRD
jgi:ADP-ribose pyrophosphatase YjhB (NUDIX family)